jgi:pimeloyl-ACP methyl ester carboxylesterase
MEGMKQIDAGVLNVGYAEAGPTDGPAVILLHGWPYDIHSYVEAEEALAIVYGPGGHTSTGLSSYIETLPGKDLAHE